MSTDHPLAGDRTRRDLPAGASGEDIAALLAQLELLWKALDLTAVAALWDDDEEVTCIVPELDSVLRGRSAIAGHLARTRSRVIGASLEIPRAWVREVAPGIALVIFVARWELVSVESHTPRHSGARVTALLRRRAQGWRLIHYMEESYHLPPGVEAPDMLDDLEAPFTDIATGLGTSRD